MRNLPPQEQSECYQRSDGCKLPVTLPSVAPQCVALKDLSQLPEEGLVVPKQSFLGHRGSLPAADGGHVESEDLAGRRDRLAVAESIGWDRHCAQYR